MILNEGKRYIRSRLLDNNAIAEGPRVITLGIGSGTIDGTRTRLFNEVSGLRAAPTISSGTSNEILFTKDYPAGALSGLVITEIGILGSMSIINWSGVTSMFANPLFNAAITSGTDWYGSGPAPFSGGNVATWNYNPTGSAAGSSFKIQYIPGSPLNIVTSGQSYQLSQRLSLNSYTGRAEIGYWMAQGGSGFVGEIFWSGSLIGSIYHTTDASGNFITLPMYDMSGTGDFVVKLSARYSGQPSGATYLYVDNFRNDRFTSGALYSQECFNGIIFTGAQEMQLNVKYKIY